jgi:hypothetical protein
MFIFPTLPVLDRLQDCWERISREQLSQLESDLRISYPAEYRHFLLKFNAGRWSHRVHTRVQQPTWCVDQVCPDDILGIVPEKQFDYADIRHAVHTFGGRIPASLVPIMRHGVGLTCVELGEQDYGKIYYWDGAHEGTDENLVHLIADSFMDFMLSLEPDYDLELRRETMPIFQAIERGEREAIHAFLAAGGTLDVRNEQGCSLLMCAARNSWPRTVEDLLKIGWDPNAVDEAGCTPLCHAVCGQSLDSIKHLIRFEARTDYRDAQGRNLAQIAKGLHYDRIYYHLAPYMTYP